MTYTLFYGGDPIVKEKTYLYAVIILTIASFAYWSAFAFNAYNTFHESSDLAAFAQSFYYDVNYPNISHGFQYAVFGNHIAPDQMLLLPFFYLFQSPMTLLIAQAFTLSMTGFVIFYVSKKLTRDQSKSFILFIAYMINPAVDGIRIFDYHAEASIIVFFVLTFYFYMKMDKKLLFLSLLLLLGTMDVAPILAIFLAVGLLVYEVAYNDDKILRKRRLNALLGMLVASFAVLLLYHIMAQDLLHGYQTGAYAGLPPFLKVLPINEDQIAHLFSPVASSVPLPGGYAAFTIFFVLFGFGMFVFFAPEITLIMALPWLAGAFYLKNYSFLFPWYQYAGLVIGATVVGSILGMLLMKEKTGMLGSFLSKLEKRDYKASLERFNAKYTITIFLAIIFATPILIVNANVNNLQQDFFFSISTQQQAYYSQLYSMIALVPSNAPLMTQFFIIPRVVDRQYVSSEVNYGYFTPEYILLDFNRNISLNVNDDPLSIYNNTGASLLLNQSTYLIYAQNGTAKLYKKA